MNWEHAHNNLVLTYRMYYNGDKLDPDFPPPQPPKEIVVPVEKPKGGPSNPVMVSLDTHNSTHNSVAGAASASHPEIKPEHIAALLESEGPQDRRMVLKEVREHLELLKEFAGVIDEEELRKRKRELFAALPPAPPPSNLRGSTPRKRPRT